MFQYNLCKDLTCASAISEASVGWIWGRIFAPLRLNACAPAPPRQRVLSDNGCRGCCSQEKPTSETVRATFGTLRVALKTLRVASETLRTTLETLRTVFKTLRVTLETVRGPMQGRDKDLAPLEPQTAPQLRASSHPSSLSSYPPTNSSPISPAWLGSIAPAALRPFPL